MKTFFAELKRRNVIRVAELLSSARGFWSRSQARCAELTAENQRLTLSLSA